MFLWKFYLFRPLKITKSNNCSLIELHTVHINVPFNKRVENRHNFRLKVHKQKSWWELQTRGYGTFFPPHHLVTGRCHSTNTSSPWMQLITPREGQKCAWIQNITNLMKLFHSICVINMFANSCLTLFAFLLRVRWEDWYHTHVCTLTMPATG